MSMGNLPDMLSPRILAGTVLVGNACVGRPRVASSAAPMEQPTLVIRGGTIVDGTGAAPFVGDIAIQGRVISAVGRDLPVI